MANISSMTLPNGTTYNIKDKVARASIPYGIVDSTSTATAYTATVEGITELYDGVIVMLHNGVVTSASGFTVDINGLGAKKCYNNLTNATQETTIFNVEYTMIFVYSEALDDGNGGWWIYRGYDSNTNTIGYQLRTNATTKKAKDRGYRYRLWFTSADDTMWVPANISTATNATTARTANTTPIDPFGPIIYTSHNTTYQAGAELNAGYQWTQYTIALGYSFTDSLPLTDNTPVYVKCLPQTDGSAIMQGTVETLPASKDGYIYIYLGQAYSTTNIELRPEHPVYWHDGNGIRLWTGAEPSTGDYLPLSGGTMKDSATIGFTAGRSLTIGNSDPYITISESGGDNDISIYATDTININGEYVDLVGTVRAPTVTAGDNSTNVATTAFVTNAISIKQDTLVSGTNIKTINGNSILGSGNISIQGGSGGSTVSVSQTLTNGAEIGSISVDGTATKLYAPTPQNITIDSALSSTSTNPVQNKIINSAISAKYTKPSGGIPASDLASGVIPTVPSAYSSNPAMNGTASPGSGTAYALGNHVHPTDTSRQATLVSGTNIKTINGNSILGSGDFAIAALPSVTTSDNGKFLRVVNGAWAADTVPSASGVGF